MRANGACQNDRSQAHAQPRLACFSPIVGRFLIRMPEAQFRFYAELNDFLPLAKRQTVFTHAYTGRPSVKDVIESLGVPHTEVDLILVNGQSEGFSCRLQPGDRISVYPVFESMDIGSLLRVRSHALRQTRFVVDVHLGKLAGYLRMLGFDTSYDNRASDEELARLSGQEKRILLTRDRGLLKRSLVTHGYCVRQTNPRQQLAEVVRRFDLAGSVRPFVRCLRCSGLLQTVEKARIEHHLPPYAGQHQDTFYQCLVCRRIYWKGSHCRRMSDFIENALAEI